MPDRIEDLKNPWRPGDPGVVRRLAEASIERLRMLGDSSNYVFLADLTHPEAGAGFGVYKPVRGERPLSDFSHGTLPSREIAAFELSQLLGWRIVPPTVACEGPHGPGSVQLFIEHDPREHYFALRERADLREQFIRFAAFDLLANNADRKGGHLLLDADGHLWGIDNALCFHRIEKLRTVIWDFAGEEIEAARFAEIEAVRNCLRERDPSTSALREVLTAAEVGALIERCDALLAHPVLPEMYPWRCVPWPVI